MPTQTECQIAKLDEAIGVLKSEIVQITRARRETKASVTRLSLRIAYFRLSRWVRSPTASLPAWPLLAFCVGPLSIGVLFLIATNEIVGSWEFAVYAFCGSALISVTLLAVLLFRPANDRLPALLVANELERTIEESKLAAHVEQLNVRGVQLQQMQNERSALVSSGRLTREMLLQRNWRAMRDKEWEEYLVEVCSALGAKVQRTGRSGDQGVDLIVEFGSRRIAVQAKGYYHAVNGKAVQEAVAGVAFYGCHASAVVTNSRFTKGARELAACNHCVLIGEDDFPKFVLGGLSL